MESIEGSILPTLPDEFVEGMYQRASTSPRNFVRETIEGLTVARPYLLHSYLVDVLRLSGTHAGEYDVLNYLRQVLFIPACFGRYLPEIRISRANMELSYGELTGLSADELQLRAVELEKRVQGHSPLLAEHLGHFQNLGVIEGVPADIMLQARRKAFRAFELYERQILDPSPSSPDLDYGQNREERPTDPIPMVKSRIVDMALLDIALNQSAFVANTVNRLKEGNEFLLESFAVARHLLDLRSYMLVGCLISHGFLEEFSQRELTLPAIAREILTTQIDETLKRARSGNDPLHELTNARQLLKEENPALFYGIELLEKVLRLDKVATANAIWHFYQGCRGQIESDYWSRKMVTE